MTVKSTEIPTKPRSPVKVAEEAIKSNTDDGLPPSTLDLGRADTDASRTIMNSLMQKIQLNTVEAAHKTSERILLEEDRKYKAAVAPNSSDPARLPDSRASVTSPIPPASERAALLKAVLDSLETDEARLQYIKDHPELTSTMPIHQISPQHPPSPTGGSMMDSMELLIKAIEIGMSMAASRSSPPTQTGGGDPIQTLQTFQEITNKTNEAYRSVIDGINAQNRDSQEALRNLVAGYQKDLADSQARIISLQVESVEKDKMFLQEQLTEMRAALNRPPAVALDQVRNLIETAKTQGIPVSVDTAERENTRHKNEIETRRLEHEIEVENRRFELESAKENRRAAAINGLSTIVSGALNTQQIKKHQLSPAGEAVAARF